MRLYKLVPVAVVLLLLAAYADYSRSQEREPVFMTGDQIIQTLTAYTLCEAYNMHITPDIAVLDKNTYKDKARVFHALGWDIFRQLVGVSFDTYYNEYVPKASLVLGLHKKGELDLNDPNVAKACGSMYKAALTERSSLDALLNQLAEDIESIDGPKLDFRTL